MFSAPAQALSFLGLRQTSGRTKRRLRWFGVLVSLLAAFAIGVTSPPARAATPISIQTTPALTPSFKASIYDYAVRCSGSATTSITTTGTGTVTIGGKSYAQPAAVKAGLVANQAVYVSEGGHTYTIRCLPADFPAYKATIDGTPQAHGYLVAPTGGPGGPTSDYVIAFDDHGVPVWWYQDTKSPINAAFYGPGHIGWWTGTASGGVDTIRNLDGTVETTVGNPGAGTALDLHDFQVLSNGDYLGIKDVSSTTDLSSWGLSPTAQVVDDVIIELDPQGQVVWSWDTLAHIDLATENANFHNEAVGNLGLNAIHMNSIQEIGNHIIMSARDLDAVYDINKTTGNIIWKLGGTSTPQSLTVVGNTYPQVFSGQHDARQLSDGSITVHDNATLETGAASRALRFQIDFTTHTATIVEDVTDPKHLHNSYCCGSANKLPGGNWLIDWGNGTYVTELSPSGARQIYIDYWPYTSYRAAAVPDSDVTLSHGMDARYPPLHL